MAILTVYFIILIALGIFEVVLLEMENFGFATLLMIGTGLLVQFLGVADLWHFTLNHFVSVVEYALAYVLMGVVWSFFRWWRYLANWKTRYTDRRTAWLQRNKLQLLGMTPEQTESMRREIYTTDIKPVASDNKSKITAWMCFWVFSIIGWAFNEPVRRIFDFLFRLFKNTYQHIADAMFKDLTELK